MKTLLSTLVLCAGLALGQNTGTWTTDYTEDATPPAAAVFTFQADPGGGLTQYWANWDDMIADILASPTITGNAIVGGEIQSAGNIVLQLGDNAGANKFSLQDSDSTEVFSVDSNGAGSYTSLSADQLAFTADTTLTLETDAVTRTQTYHLIAAESGTADDLATISGGVEGYEVILFADAGDTITVKDGTGNIDLPSGDVTMTGTAGLRLLYNGTNWLDANSVGKGGSGGGSGYSMVFGGNDSAHAPADSTTYYIGAAWLNSSSVLANVALVVPRTGTLVEWRVRARVQGLGSDETVSHYLRIEDTTDVGQIDTTYDAEFVSAGTTLSQAVTAGQTIVVKMVSPAWATNPTNISYHFTAVIE